MAKRREIRKIERLEMVCGHNDCQYAITLMGGACDYLGQTGKLRGCKADINCIRYKSTIKASKPIGFDAYKKAILRREK